MGAAFRVEARIIAALANGTYCAQLKNAHRLTAFVAGPDKQHFAGAKPGDTVTLQLTPYDLSVGRILVATKNFKHESQSVSKKNV